MQLLHTDFFELIHQSKDENGTTSTIRINAQHAIFKGHFPSNPITPGVVEIELIKELLEIQLNRTIHLSKLINCKFLSILNPEKHPVVRVVISTKSEDQFIKIDAVIEKESEVFLKMKAAYTF